MCSQSHLFFFNDTATTEIYTLSLHDALPICEIGLGDHVKLGRGEQVTGGRGKASILSDTLEAVLGAIHISGGLDRKSTRLNSSHANISYAVFCLKKKNKTHHHRVFCRHRLRR